MPPALPPTDDRPTQTATRQVPLLESGVVRVIDGPDRGRKHILRKGGAVLVGSGVDVDFRLNDRKVSRRHCQVRLGALAFNVTDLKSRNGTYFEGSRIGEVALPPGALLRVGDMVLALSPEADAGTQEPSARTAFGELVGQSLPMRRAFGQLERAAACDATVLLGGETGVGKELAARAIHQASSRARGPYEVFDCGAVPASLLQAELFGHEKGAFTGALTSRAGVFERGHGGTVFLDEIAEVPIDLQAALLRVCDHGEVRRTGGAASTTVDVRLIAATRRDLPAEVVAGRFREDLYYRLAVLPIMLPPLRTRREDLSLLCARILRELGVKDPGAIEGPGLAALQAYSFPGNVRELRNLLERALILSGAGPNAIFVELPIGVVVGPAGPGAVSPVTPGPRDGAAVVAGPKGFQDLKQAAVDDFEKRYLSDLMVENVGNIKKASRVSGIERTQLKRLLRKHGLL